MAYYRRMTRLSVALAAVLLLAGGCKNKVVDQLEDFADQACACEDAACAEKVQEAFNTWRENNQTARGTEEHRKRAETAMKKLSGCLAENLPAEPPSEATPPAAQPAPEPEAGEPEAEPGATD